MKRAGGKGAHGGAWRRLLCPTTCARLLHVPHLWRRVGRRSQLLLWRLAERVEGGAAEGVPALRGFAVHCRHTGRRPTKFHCTVAMPGAVSSNVATGTAGSRCNMRGGWHQPCVQPLPAPVSKTDQPPCLLAQPACWARCAACRQPSPPTPIPTPCLAHHPACSPSAAGASPGRYQVPSLATSRREPHTLGTSSSASWL